MVDVFDTLDKHKNRIKKIQKKENSKKIKRTISRPWQENLGGLGGGDEANDLGSSALTLRDERNTLPPLIGNESNVNRTQPNSILNSTELTTELNRTQPNSILNSTELTEKAVRRETELHTEPNRTQLNSTELKPNSILNSTELKKPNSTELHTEPNRTQLNSILNSILNSTSSKNLEKCLFSLSGNRKKIVFGLCAFCLENRTNCVEEVTYSVLGEMLGIRSTSIKTAIRKLKTEGFYTVQSSRGGRGAKMGIYLSDDLIKIYSKYMINKTELATELKPNSILNSSSSSFNINNKTTTSEGPGWNQIHIPPALKLLSFDVGIIKQVRERNLLTADELQASLDAFAFDVCENDLIKTKKINDPIRYFMGIINKKMPYTPPWNFMSDEQKALEENKKRLESLRQLREELENTNAELALEEWLSSLSKEHKIKLVPENDFIKAGSPFHSQMLMAHYRDSLKNGISPNDPLCSSH